MKIIVKTIQGVLNEYEIEPETTTVGELKGMINAKQGIDIQNISLIYKSRMLKDNAQTLGGLGINEGDSIVMVVKKSAVPAPKPAPVTQPENHPTEPVPQVTTQPITTNQPSTQPVDIFQPQQRQQVNVEPTEENINHLVEMGFLRDDAIKALRKSQNNTAIAADFLISGVDLDNIPDQPAGGYEEEDPQEPNSILNLTKEQFIELCREQPQIIEPFLQHIESENPQLAQLMRNNPGMVYDIIKGQTNNNRVPSESQPIPQQPNHAPSQPQLSPEDNAAIDRLCALGFGRSQCLQAYIACDKNEQLAANFLLDGFD
ncbi:UV excision repair protein rad23, putative [Entamoeba dispar SAW760]|uniref:UV excision repair protein RAD23 n=1 Tax=Entamoeba dispar (strain ATCC PRA-260 / SAW760) TaxID=370354 RepID=B0ENW1_ENTDS|nr:UV excision repair protein rad23, putative [Entamoeba dispar SAW760]EDR23800.1 UV excision repair protein rad23, putative [Entamoeba dispar SAW760]|eukprot:EDR23800.1 UV excision repair protein rad23, putative [Entamoeba dispar SAW760]